MYSLHCRGRQPAYASSWKMETFDSDFDYKSMCPSCPRDIEVHMSIAEQSKASADYAICLPVPRLLASRW